MIIFKTRAQALVAALRQPDAEQLAPGLKIFIHTGGPPVTGIFSAVHTLYIDAALRQSLFVSLKGLGQNDAGVIAATLRRRQDPDCPN